MDANTSLRRRLNDDRRRRFGASGRLIAFLCECSDGCSETVVLTPESYDARRGGPILHPLHTALREDAGGQDLPDSTSP